MKTQSVAVLLCLAAAPASAAAIDLPSSVASNGVLRMAVGNRIPPLSFHDPATGRLTGFEVDLGEALAAKLGVGIAWTEAVGFQTMLLAIQTGRTDAAIGAIVDLVSRRATASFVDYLRTGAQFFVETDRAAEVADLASLCGRRIGASSATYFPAEVTEWSSAHCGDRPMVVVGTDGTGDARSQLKQGRIDAAVQGSETLAYLMAVAPGTYAPVGSPPRTRYDGIAVAKDDVALRDALTAALDALIADGTYRTLLAKWHLEASGIDAATVDAGP